MNKLPRTLIQNISQLVTNDPLLDGTQLGLVQNAAIVIEDGKVLWVGESNKAPRDDDQEVVDANGQAVIPGFVDSHNHLVFMGDRSADFARRMAGGQYSPDGISYTVGLTRQASNNDLQKNAENLLTESLNSGTTTIEIKSGYGLTVADEERSLKIAASLTKESTFLGAHVIPEEFKAAPEDYVDLVCGPMLEAAKSHAKWIDVFCDRGAFNPEQTRKILKAGIGVGLKPRLHANQLEQGEGIAVGVELGAASVDHITHYSQADISLLAASTTVGTFLPGAEFSTRTKYPDARPLLEAGVSLAIATDCNPGSSCTSNMSFVIALAVREFFFSPEQALWSATKGGAKALQLQDVGHLGVGASADFLILKAPSYLHLAYRPGVDLIEQVWRNGRKLK